MEYKDYQYLWPPRPKKSLPIDMLGFYKKRGWWGQVKKNGTCNVIFVSPDGDVIFKTRHNDNHKAWKPSKEIKDIIRKYCKGNNWYVLESELLHNKTRNIKDTIYIFDILVYRGEFLDASTFEDRQTILGKMFNSQGEETFSHLVVDKGLWLAKNWSSENLKELYSKTFDREEDEGIVVKNPKGTLQLCNKKDNNSGWQVKVRKKTENYSF